MGTPIAHSPSRTTSWTGWLFRGIGLGLLGCVLVWAGASQLERARLVMSSTFQVQRGMWALGQFLFLLAGAVFSAIVLMAINEQTKRSGLLVGGALPPLLLLLLFFDAFGPGLLVSIRNQWILRGETQASAAVALGVMVGALVWQFVKRRRASHDT